MFTICKTWIFQSFTRSGGIFLISIWATWPQSPGRRWLAKPRANYKLAFCAGGATELRVWFKLVSSWKSSNHNEIYLKDENIYFVFLDDTWSQLDRARHRTEPNLRKSLAGPGSKETLRSQPDIRPRFIPRGQNDGWFVRHFYVKETVGLRGTQKSSGGRQRAERSHLRVRLRARARLGQSGDLPVPPVRVGHHRPLFSHADWSICYRVYRGRVRLAAPESQSHRRNAQL